MHEELRLLEEEGYAEYIERIVTKGLPGIKMKGFYQEVYELLKEHNDSLTLLRENFFKRDAHLKCLVDFHDKNCPELYAAVVVFYRITRQEFNQHLYFLE